MIRLLLAVAMATPGAAPASLPNRPVATLDRDRYLGQWHEIAHLPMFFQRRCIDTVTATYTRRPDGRIGVHNACRTARGVQASDGVARPVAGAPGALKVRFAPAWLGWLPFVWADYWVIALDPDYGWAMVGSPSRKYLWVLSRHPTMDGALFRQLREQARARGYPVDELVMTAPLH